MLLRRVASVLPSYIPSSAAVLAIHNSIRVNVNKKFGLSSTVPGASVQQTRAFSATPRAGEALQAAPIVSAPASDSFTVPVYSLETGEPTGNYVDLDPSIFGVPVRKDILHRAVVWKLACLRRGTARSKTRGEMNGSKKKLFPQKGRGAARVGEKRAPHRRGGGKAHGPKPRDFSYTLPKKVRRLALRCALAAKFAHNKLRIIADCNIAEPRTNPLARKFASWGLQEALIVDKESSSKPSLIIQMVSLNLYLAARNLPNISVVSQQKSNVYDILHTDMLLLNQATLPYFFDRVNGLLPTVFKKKGKYGLIARAAREAEATISADDEEREMKQ